MADERTAVDAATTEKGDARDGLVDALGGLSGRSLGAASARVDALCAEVEGLESQRAELDGRLAALDEAEVDAAFVSQALRDWDRVWDVLSTENRWRLCRAVVERIFVDQPAGAIEVHLVDLGLAPTVMEAAS